MYGLFATRTIPSKTRLKGNYTGEAITKEQLAFRTKTADKIMQINGALVDGTDPRFATWWCLANTSVPDGHHNTEADNAESGKAVIFTTVGTIEANEQILWEYHSIFDDTNALADFSNPTSCDLRTENLAPIPTANDLTDPSTLDSGDVRAENRVTNSTTTASSPYHPCQFCPAQHPLLPPHRGSRTPMQQLLQSSNPSQRNHVELRGRWQSQICMFRH